jgi:uncharacterized repeat protein (TIGR03987 family)
MPPLVRAAVLFMVAALVFYSFGVWATFLSRQLRPRYVGLFWLGFLSDTAGTELMRRLAGSFHWSLHTASGVVALLLMFLHAVWATIVLLNRTARPTGNFHRISLTVWAIWLIPFISGMLLSRHRG